MKINKNQLKKLRNLNFSVIEFDKDNNIIETTTTATIFEDENNMVHISGKDEKGLIDYYGEFRGGYPYIDPILEKFAKENGFYWEWDNPGSICLAE